MSWSISASGSKEEQPRPFAHKRYGVPYKPGTPEGDDVVAAVARIEALAEDTCAVVRNGDLDARTVAKIGEESETGRNW